MTISTMLVDDVNEITLPSGQLTDMRVIVALVSGNALDDWASFTLTIKKDPEWPRLAREDQEEADPTGEQWESVVVATGSIVVGATPTLSFLFNAPSDPGYRRYAFDVWGIGGDAGNVALVKSTWLTITSRTR